MNGTSEGLNNKKGTAMIFVMVAMLIVFMMIAIATGVTQANLRQAAHQEKGIKAYYIARSGVELAYEALLTTTPSLLDQFASGTITTLTENDVDFEEGTADVTVTTSGTGDTKKIIITSVGTLDSTGETRTVTMQFYIKYDDYPDMEWSY